MKSPLALANSRRLRLYAEDDDALEKLRVAYHPATGLDIVELIRRAVHSGLPIVTRKLRKQCGPVKASLD